MQAAFIDIGEARTAFLHIDDLVSRNNKKTDAQPAEISHLLHDGQQIVVQVIKDPVGSKGARLSAELSIASYNLVYMPDIEHIGISQRLEDEEERERLKTTLTAVVDELKVGGGYISAHGCRGCDRGRVAQCRGLSQSGLG